MSMKIKNGSRVIEYHPTYTQVKYYRRGRTEKAYYSHPHWKNWRFHTTLYLSVILFALTTLLFKQVHVERTTTSSVVVAQVITTPPPIPSPTPMPTPEPPAPGWYGFIKKVERIADIYDFPVKVAVAQAALESDRGNSTLAINKKNFFGLNAVDWDPYNQAWSFSTEEECILEYMRLIKRQYPEAYAARHNPNRMIELIKAGGYASDPNYVWKIRNMPEWSTL